MGEKRLVIDLCSGLGGFSSAFKDDSNYKVIRVDIEKKFKPDICKDVRELLNDKDFMKLKPFLITASPPCTYFSLANPTFPRPGIMEALSIVGACLEIISRLKPKYYILENPKGRLRWYIGTPQIQNNLSYYGYKTIKPTDFWTNINLPQLPKIRKNKEGISFSKSAPHSPCKRAELPYNLSKAIKEAIND